MPNTVIMAVAFGVLQSLESAAQKGVSHGFLHPNGIWLGMDGALWIDGYGSSSDSESKAQDIYMLGCLLIEMFLGNNPFPVSPENHLEQMRNIGLELQAMGLPNKLPRQILSLVHPDPNKRPPIDLLVRKWKLTRAKPIVSSWVQSQFPMLYEAHRPEDRIPTSTRIAPSPFPPELKVAPEPVIEEPQALLDDDTLLRKREEAIASIEDEGFEHTQSLTESVDGTDSIDITEEPSEETQAIQFLDSFEAEFFDSEPTSKLLVESVP
jgi:serine/threonine protein kinase